MTNPKQDAEGRAAGALLGARITLGIRQALDECSSCCLDDADDRKRVERTILERVAEAFEKQRVAEAFEKHQKGE